MAWVVPLLLVLVADGVRGVKEETWPVLLSVGLTFAVAQWVSSTWISVELTDVIASLAALGAGVLALRVWHPKNTHAAELRLAGVRDAESAAGFKSTLDLTHEVVRKPNGKEIAMALFPYLLVIAVFSVAKLVPPSWPRWPAPTSRSPGRGCTATCSTRPASRTARPCTTSPG